MADTQETSADIIAEMRRRIAVKMSDAWYTQEEWRELCDRLEAAWKRERGDFGHRVKPKLITIEMSPADPATRSRRKKKEGGAK